MQLSVGKQLLERVADNLGMPAFVQEHHMRMPFFQCPLCRGTDVIGAVEAPGEAMKIVTFHPYCRACGYAEHGALVEEEESPSVPAIFTRWLHPSRRKWSSPVFDTSPREWTCTTCGSSQIAFGQYERHTCAFCGVKRFASLDEAN